MFVFGLMMRGAMFEPQTGDLLTTLIYCGGFLGNLATGMLYLSRVWLGYTQPDIAGHVDDYGTKFLVAAGLLNVLAMVDAYEIAMGRRTDPEDESHPLRSDAAVRAGSPPMCSAS